LSIYVEARGHRNVRRVMVFASGDNPVWQKLSALETQARRAIPTSRLKAPVAGHGDPDTPPPPSPPAQWPSKAHDLLGVSRPVLAKWQAGGAANVANAYVQIRELRKALDAFGRERTDALQRDAMNLSDRLADYLTSAEAGEPVRESGVKLGYRDANDVRQALERLFHRAHPLFKRPWSTAEVAKNELRHLQGVHSVWMKRGADMYLRCMMDFRYVVDFQEGHAIRVKLEVPMISSDGPNDPNGAASEHETYDGWIMMTQTGRIFLTFETRNGDARADFIFMIIDNWPRQGEGKGWRAGSYLTAGQDNDNQAVNSYLLMRRAMAGEQVQPRKVVRDVDDEFAVIAGQAVKLALEGGPAA
jgi:hypothetical protein